MDGLFEDDANVRKQPKQKKKKVASKPRSQGVGQRLVRKVESKGSFVSLASGGGSDFTDVDITVAKRASAKKKETAGRIEPPINYISDE